ncbi:MAG: AbrB family transcriptional regulator [Nitrososphaeraceae archaeon]
MALNSPKKASLRTTIPMFIVKQWRLKAGDKLDWSLEARKDELVILVKKAETKSGKKKG